MLRKIIRYLYSRYCKDPIKDLYGFPNPGKFYEMTTAEQEAYCAQAKILLEDNVFNFIVNEYEKELESQIIYSAGNVPITVTPAELDRFQIKGVLGLIEKFQQYASMNKSENIIFDKHKVV